MSALVLRDVQYFHFTGFQGGNPVLSGGQNLRISGLRHANDISEKQLAIIFFPI
jgi:hypothetical protein